MTENDLEEVEGKKQNKNGNSAISLEFELHFVPVVG